jgi:hypothetical protein
MLNTVLCRTASFARAFLLGAWAWMLWVPVTQAAEAMPSGMLVISPFKHYQTWRDEALQDWRATNDRVGEIGGWLTYLRDAQQGNDSAQPAAQGQHGHHGH